MAQVPTETADTLRGLSLGESSVLEGLLGGRWENQKASGLDPRAYALVQIAALIAVDAPPASFLAQVALAGGAGIPPEDLLGVLVAVAPQVGVPRVVAAARELMLVLGPAVDRG